MDHAKIFQTHFQQIFYIQSYFARGNRHSRIFRALSQLYHTLSAIFTGITIALDVIFVLYIINSDINAEYKIAWIVPILFLPILGCLFYIIFGRKRLSRFTRKKLTRNFRGVECLYESRRGVLERFEETDAFFAS